MGIFITKLLIKRGKEVEYGDNSTINCINSVIYRIERKNKKLYDTFIEGAKEGIKTAVKLFPTLIGIFIGVNMLRSSGLIDFFGIDNFKITITF